MESSRILVTGLPKGTTETDLVIYFQSTRDSGGGDVKKIEIEDGQAFITFEDSQAAARIVEKRKHYIKDHRLLVSLLPEEVESCPEDGRDADTSMSDQVNDGRGDLPNCQGNQTSTNENESDSAQAWLGRDRTTPDSRWEALQPQQGTVKVTGLSDKISEDLLKNYFENARRSKGGPISKIDLDSNLLECVITFESPDDAARIVENSPHKVSGLFLDVTFLEERGQQDVFRNTDQAESDDEANITIIVSGTLPSEDTLRHYFENSRRSGGGEVLELYFNDEGDATITLTDVTDLKRLLERPHLIDKRPITVIKRPPKKKVPLDPLRLHVQGLKEGTSGDSLLYYLEKFSNVDVTNVYMGHNNNAMAVFASEPDFETLFDKISRDRRGLEGKYLRLERVPICTCIQVKGLRKESSEETIELYFENTKRSGGGIVSRVERTEKDQALVYFEDPSSVEAVIKRSSHSLEGQKLEVKPFYPFLENSTINKTDVAFDAEVYDYIEKNHHQELQTVLDEQMVVVKLSDDPQSPTIKILPSEKKKDSRDSWLKRVGGLELFLKSFKKTKIPIGAELFDEMVRRWKNYNDQNGRQGGSSHYVVSFNKQSRCVQIIGREKYVDEEGLTLKQLIDAAQRDTELMKTIVEVDMVDILKSRLALLKMCNIGESLQSKHKHLSITIDLKSNKLHLKGPRNVLQEVQLEIYKFISNVTEQSLELPANVIAVLKNPQVSDFIASLLRKKSIQALFNYHHNKSSNEILVVGAGSESVRDAELVLQNAVQENSLKLTDENALVLESHQWKVFKSNLASTNKIGIFEDPYANTLWVCGIAEDVQICFDRVKQFLNENTILHETFSTDQGKARFILEKWGSKIEKIKKDLATCCVDMRAATDCEGIEISGTEEGLVKCMAKLKEIENAVQKDSISIDKPGMKKFILEEKGSKSLRAIEKSNNCIILTSERNEHEMSFADLEDTKDSVSGMSSAKFMCSYLTVEGKKVSVFKGDLTKHRVDAIVNAANSQLDHIGGLAYAIVKAGGQEIQSQCDEYIQDKGDLLEGHTMVTTAGALPCHKIIHTVGPRWDQLENQEKKERKKRLLRYAITNCLKTAKTSRSIAIPAVSSGVYGVPRDVCAEVIVDAIVDFSAENPSCQLTEIHLVNNDDPTVRAFLQEMRKRFSGKTTFVDVQKPNNSSSGITTGSSGTREKLKKKPFFQTTRCIKITVKVGDLAKEKADVLVGSTGQNLSLENNPCASALSKAAGQCLQQQCTNNGPVAEGDIAVLSQTGKLDCRVVIFAVCCHWNNGRGKETLKKIIKKCLQEADKRKMTSIAFAAIGTGVLQFPRDQVAELYFNEVISYDQKNPKTSLREVKFVLFHKDAPTIQAFKTAELKSQASGSISAEANAALKPKKGRVITSLPAGSSTFSPVKERRPGHLETTAGPLCLQVQAGDITRETTEAIAVISNCDLDVAASGAGAAILRSGGNSIKEECSRRGPQVRGSVVVTKAGKLKARYLYHIVPSGQPTDGIKEHMLQCLQEAENNGISSISFPAIGTGNIGISAKACAHAMLSAIQELSKRTPTSLKLIKVTIFQESMIKEFRSAMEEASGVKPSQEPARWRQALKTVVSAFGFGSSDEDTTLTASPQEVDNKVIRLEIVAGCKKDLQEASKEINELVKEKCKQKVIENEEISNLTQEHMRKLHTLELRYSVELKVEREVDRIVIDGQYEDVLQVFGEILELLHEVEKVKHERNHAEMLSKDIQWKYDDNGTFEDYEGDLNAQIELIFQKNKTCIAIQMDETDYRINFDTMTMEDEYGNVSEVKRIDLRKDVEFPHYWTPQPTDSSGREKTVHLVQLDPATNAQEYTKVSDQFRNTLRNNILKIERVQNPALYGAYIVYKQKMDKAGGKGSNEMRLFHGTKGQKCQLINDKGFNRSFCGENAACYGNGVYFALHASYSARSTYSPPDPNGLRYMYLVKVLVGEYTVGRQGIVTPPVKNINNIIDTYDTVVDNVNNPGIFVVFYDWQCYPEYLITFQ